MAYDPNIPYDDLPRLPPGADVETKAVLKQCLRAARALAELKGAGGLIPDQSILINAIPFLEAKMSSEIENIVTTQDELFEAALEDIDAASPPVKEVLRYRTALKHGFDELAKSPLTLDLIRRVCGILRDEDMDFRRADERVAIINRSNNAIIYTPPTGGPDLFQKLENLVDFLLVPKGPDPLIRMAVAHYQFEAIHPFTDGNGRTGRILNILYMLHSRLLNIPVLYLSRFIIRNKGRYYTLLRDVTETGDWEPWLL